MTSAAGNAPKIQLTSMDELWFQVAGTLCNLECTHCFISCSPTNDSFGHLSLDEVRKVLPESRRAGVREYYFTGGEPFLNRELVPMVKATLEYGPVTVLTNATVLREEWLKELREAEAASLYCLEFRVSIDGPDAATNDPIRGKGTFVRAMQGVTRLCSAGFLPIITMTRTWSLADEPQILTEFRQVLADAGCTRPRLKVLPRLQIGAEETRTCGYADYERVTDEMMVDYDESQLLCTRSRTITDKGVYVCPILIDAPEARLGGSLADADAEFQIDHGACYTCYQYGAICTNTTSRPRHE